MSNIKLYECTADVQAALNHHFDSETERTDTLEAVIGQFEIKAQSVIAYHLNQQAELAALDAHIKAMQAKKKALQSKADNLKAYLLRNMQATGIREIKAHDGTFTAKIAKNPASVDIYDEAQIADDYCQFKREIGKTAIKEALQAGIEVQGARLVQSEGLRIK